MVSPIFFLLLWRNNFLTHLKTFSFFLKSTMQDQNIIIIINCLVYLRFTSSLGNKPQSHGTVSLQCNLSHLTKKSSSFIHFSMQYIRDLVKIHYYPLLEHVSSLGEGEKFTLLKHGSSKQYTGDTERLIFLIYWCHLFPQLHLNFKMVE